MDGIDRYTQPTTPDIRVTPEASSWTLYRADNGTWYAAGIVNGESLHLYALERPDRWRLSCGLQLTPKSLRQDSDPAVRAALQSIDSLYAAVTPLIGGSGNCYGYSVGGLWQSRLQDSLFEALYRPWLLLRKQPDGSANSHGDYGRTLSELYVWSLMGLAEHAAFRRYDTQLASTIDTLQRLYMQKFGWNTATSARMAYEATTTAVANSMGFYDFAPFGGGGEQQLREAIFAQRPVAELQTIDSEVAARSAVLDIAVRYPQALHYLLRAGADPNHGNAFGKTPLMHAAQYNLLPAARQLLAAGADPNAATRWPDDQCYYNLQTAKMTALHYAVRYASAEMVELLVRSGAATFYRTEQSTGSGAYPLDWFERYNTPGAAEVNPNLSAARGSELRALLRVPAAEERTKIANELVRRAEADYAAGRIQQAYRSLQTARRADESNQRALDDLGLVALKAGFLGEALLAASTLIDSDAATDIKARAWFNVGMACRQAGLFFRYNDRAYCTEGALGPFLNAWQAQPATASKNKLQELFTSNAIATCTVQSGGVQRQFHFVQSQSRSLRIYVYHSVSQSVDPSQVSWSHYPDTARITPRLQQRYDFGTFAISVLETAEFPPEVTIGDQTCRTDNFDDE